MIMDFGFIFIYAGVVALSLCKKQHSRQVWPGYVLPSLQTLAMRIFGWSGLVSSLVIYINVQGTGIGIISWLGLLTVSILLQTLVLAYKPKWVVGITLVILICSYSL